MTQIRLNYDSYDLVKTQTRPSCDNLDPVKTAKPQLRLE